MALVLGLPVLKATSVPDLLNGWGGHVLFGGDTSREHAMTALAGELGENPDWPPASPSPTSTIADERLIAKYLDELGLGQADYKAIVAETLEHAAGEEFKRLESTLTALMSEGLTLFEGHINDVHETVRKGLKPSEPDALTILRDRERQRELERKCAALVAQCDELIAREEQAANRELKHTTFTARVHPKSIDPSPNETADEADRYEEHATELALEPMTEAMLAHRDRARDQMINTFREWDRINTRDPA
jgi:hypothetical protein